MLVPKMPDGRWGGRADGPKGAGLTHDSVGRGVRGGGSGLNACDRDLWRGPGRHRHAARLRPRHPLRGGFPGEAAPPSRTVGAWPTPTARARQWWRRATGNAQDTRGLAGQEVGLQLRAQRVDVRRRRERAFPWRARVRPRDGGGVPQGRRGHRVARFLPRRSGSAGETGAGVCVGGGAMHGPWVEGVAIREVLTPRWYSPGRGDPGRAVSGPGRNSASRRILGTRRGLLGVDLAGRARGGVEVLVGIVYGN